MGTYHGRHAGDAFTGPYAQELLHSATVAIVSEVALATLWQRPARALPEDNGGFTWSSRDLTSPFDLTASLTATLLLAEKEHR